MRRIAIATSISDDVNLDPDVQILLDALLEVGIEGSMCVWNDRSVQWEDFELTVIRSTWDYTRDREGYLAWARGIERLFNPYPIIEYSTDKHYQHDLERLDEPQNPRLRCCTSHRPSSLSP